MEQEHRPLAENAPVFRLISGSATGVNPDELFDDPAFTFQATVIPTNLINNAILDYMSRADAPVITSAGPKITTLRRIGRIAILRESNTGFGSSQRDKDEKSGHATANQADARSTGDGPALQPDVLDIPFPVSISRLKIDLDALSSVTPSPVPIIGQNGELVPVKVYRDYVDAVPLAKGHPTKYVFEPPIIRPCDLCEPNTSPESRDRTARLTGWENPSTKLTMMPSRGFLIVLILLACAATAIAFVVKYSWRVWYLSAGVDDPVSGGDLLARVSLWGAGTLAVYVVVPVLTAAQFETTTSLWYVAQGAVWWVLVMALVTAVTQFWRRWVAAGAGDWRLTTSGAFTFVWIPVVSFWALWQLHPAHREDHYFWLVRASDVAAGLSPVIPTILLAAALAAVSGFQLKYSWGLRKERTVCPFPPGRSRRWNRAVKEDQRIRRLFHTPTGVSAAPKTFRWWVAVNRRACALRTRATLGRWQTYAILLPFFGFGIWFSLMQHRTPETRAHQILVTAAGWLAAGLILGTLIKFLDLWAHVKELLGHIADLPLAIAFEQLPPGASRLFSGYLYSIRPDRFDGIIRQQWAACGGNYGEPNLSRVAGAVLTRVLGPIWATRKADKAFGRAAPSEEADAPKTSDGSSDTAPQADPREVFVALIIVQYISQFFVAMRRLAWSLTIAAPLLLLSAASYPFQPERPLLYALMALLGAVVVGILHVLYDLNKNELVSRIIKTAPNRFTLDRGFLASIGQHVLPIFGVAVAYLLGAFRIVLEPLVSALR